MSKKLNFFEEWIFVSLVIISFIGVIALGFTFFGSLLSPNGLDFVGIISGVSLFLIISFFITIIVRA